ncbi:threonine/serine exporter family protein [Lactiplantibacillus mudanjiangensis]|uniref:Threonine/serine exporter [Lactobacillus sp.] n=1 Tax=Lactiplantibacillus mudanjiangensis TaxID=1296538 RepID=A0A660E194_9LACO|nr:threonine/serine exporter family protein [Lactiplantibacillus mudanjiangensis]VDG25115.1 threonine/serine exporter [Lactobacillus sp.] [Lactiplantibacillus mudanjiangensis]VDG29476.1 threonine/serine exporter [Lactobacillus sp.] [Lactiplantibacillus mudanjiangensis]
MLTMLGQLALAYVAVLGFGLIINIPRRALNVAGWIGTLTWGCYLIVQSFDGGVVLGSLIGSIGIGVLGNLAAHYKKMPSIIFNIPSLVSFVPGSQAYQMVRNFAVGRYLTAVGFMLQVVMITGAIALGFLLAELINRLITFCLQQWGRLRQI